MTEKTPLSFGQITDTLEAQPAGRSGVGYTSRGWVVNDENSVEIPLVSGWITAQTTDDTVTDVATIAAAELEAKLVVAEFIGAKSDYSAALGAVLRGQFRRATAGNVTLIGSLRGDIDEDSGDAPTVTLAADTTAQTIDIRVTGVAAETWNWKVRYTVIDV
jgi:hypothetical protein